MAARLLENGIEPEYIRLLALGFGLSHPYRVLSLGEIAASMRHVSQQDLKETLEQLASEGLLTRFSGRYCFNKAIPEELRNAVGQAITPSGSVRSMRDRNPREREISSQSTSG